LKEEETGERGNESSLTYKSRERMFETKKRPKGGKKRICGECRGSSNPPSMRAREKAHMPPLRQVRRKRTVNEKNSRTKKTPPIIRSSRGVKKKKGYMTFE